MTVGNGISKPSESVTITRPITSLRDLHAASPNFVAQFATVLSSSKAFETFSYMGIYS